MRGKKRKRKDLSHVEEIIRDVKEGKGSYRSHERCGDVYRKGKILVMMRIEKMWKKVEEYKGEPR